MSPSPHDSRLLSAVATLLGTNSESMGPSTTTFFFEGQPVEWEFFKDEKGKVIGLGFKGQPETMGKKQ